MNKSFNKLYFEPLPSEAASILSTLKVPPRLKAHLILVHNVADRLLNEIYSEWHDLNINCEAVLFGAAMHDIGKCICIEELQKQGHKHEAIGKKILLDFCIPEEKAKFAATHAHWSKESAMEELLVSLSDKIWKGSRVEDLENLLVARIADEAKMEKWEVFSKLDSFIARIAKNADLRLSWQKQFAVKTGE